MYMGINNRKAILGSSFLLIPWQHSQSRLGSLALKNRGFINECGSDRGWHISVNIQHISQSLLAALILLHKLKYLITHHGKNMLNSMADGNFTHILVDLCKHNWSDATPLMFAKVW